MNIPAVQLANQTLFPFLGRRVWRTRLASMSDLTFVALVSDYRHREVFPRVRSFHLGKKYYIMLKVSQILYCKKQVRSRGPTAADPGLTLTYIQNVSNQQWY